MTHPQLREEIKNAMRAKDEVRLSVLRGLLTSCTNELVAKGKKPTDELPEDDVMALVRRAAKQRKDSIEQFENGGRADLAEKEKTELIVLESMLPAQMSREEVEAAVKAKAAELGMDLQAASAEAPAGRGKNQLMGALMKDLKGKADGNLVKEVVDLQFT